MVGLDIALSGLRVAQQALATVGTNMANVSTDGYHRQTVRVSARDSGSGTGVALGGATVASITRAIDSLLESEILSQRPLQGQLTQELSVLRSAESALGSLDTGGLWASLEDFFSSLSELAGQSDSLALQDQAVRAADALAGQFRQLGAFFGDLDRQIVMEMRTLVAQANDLAGTVAELNGQIQARTAAGDNGNALMDQRDQAISDLSELLEVQISDTGSAGVVNVTAGGIPLLTGASALCLEVDWMEDGLLGVGAAESGYLRSDLRGGKIGGLLSLKNDLLAGVQEDLNTLAGFVASSVNALHVQGVGTAGSFAELTGEPVSDSVLADWDAEITAGEFYVRILEGATGAVTRHAVSVDPATDDIETLAARLNALDGLSASAANGTLHIQADTGFHFDFLPAVASEPYTSTLTGTAAPTLGGTYTGTENQIYTCTVVEGGQVGLTPGLGLEVRNGAGELVRTVNVGAAYASGDRLELDDGLWVSLSAGTLAAGEAFTAAALARSDPTGALAAAGINTLFSGNTMSTLSVRADVLADPRRLATAVGPDGTDNVNIRRLAELARAAAEALDGQTPLEACQRIMTDLGQEVAVRQTRKKVCDSLLAELENQRAGTSGVDLNEESARLLAFQQMFQSMAKYISVLDQSMRSLLEVL